MPLRMLCAMNQQPRQRCRQALAPNPSRCLIARRITRRHTLHRPLQPRISLRQNLGRCACIHLRSQCRKLCLIQRTVLRIRQQTIQRASHVSQLKRHMRQPMRPGKHLLLAQLSCPTCNIFFRLLQRMDHRTPQRIKLLMRSPHPRLRLSTHDFRLTTQRAPPPTIHAPRETHGPHLRHRDVALPPQGSSPASRRRSPFLQASPPLVPSRANA